MNMFKSCLLITLLLISLEFNNHNKNVYCWGSDGHKIVVRIAERFFSSQTETLVNKQLGEDVTLEELSVLPDNYRSSPSSAWSANLHYVNFLPNDKHFEFKPACDKGCVVTALLNYTDRLITQYVENDMETCTDSAKVEPCSLSFLIHFTGDVHQPMHAGYASDRGGNDFKLQWLNNTKCTNLHSTWDSKILNRYKELTNDNWHDIADKIIDFLEQHPHILQSYSSELEPQRWCNESFYYARNTCYNFAPSTVTPSFPTTNTNTIYSNYYKKNNIKNNNNNNNHIRSSSSSSVSNSNSVDGIYSSNGYVFEEFVRLNHNANMEEEYYAAHLSNNRQYFLDNTCGAQATDYYYERTIPIVLERMAQAGVRLAAKLNSIYN